MQNCVDARHTLKDAGLTVKRIQDDYILGRSQRKPCSRRMINRKRNLSIAKLKNVVAELIRLGDPTLPRAATRLQISARSLQRQLESVGITYSDLVDTTRYEIAKSLLGNTKLDIAEVAATLGYRDPSSFSRAFTRWSGRGPREFRNAARLETDSFAAPK